MTSARPTAIDPDLAGTRALLLDLDGVLVLRGRMIPGAHEALDRLDRAGFPWLVGTNMSIVSRATLAAELASGGLAIPVDRIMTASSAAAAYAARRFPDRPIFVMGAPDGLREFEGQRLIGYDEAAEPECRVAAVIVGDAGPEFSARNMQSAFRLIREGAAFVAMHKNRWWLTPEGTLLDSGAYVQALEFGTEKRAVVTGKPNATFFLEAVRRLAEICVAADPTAATLRPAEVAMVGDDLWNDIKGAQRSGLRGVFVRSGKHGDADLARFAADRPPGRPDAIAQSIVEVVDAILEERE